MPIIIGMSRCLMGDPVRYDGRSKYSETCHLHLADCFVLYSVCPEVESGLSIPRPPIELVKCPNGLKALGRDDSSLDVASQLQSFCDRQVAGLSFLSGFVLVPRSPSCGLNTVPIKSPRGRPLSKNGSGLFVTNLREHFPDLPVIEEPDLSDHYALSLFQLRVIFYYLIRQGTVFSKELLAHQMYRDLVHNVEQNYSIKKQIMALNKRLNEMEESKMTDLLVILREHQCDD